MEPFSIPWIHFSGKWRLWDWERRRRCETYEIIPCHRFPQDGMGETKGEKNPFFFLVEGAKKGVLFLSSRVGSANTYYYRYNISPPTSFFPNLTV